MAAQLRAAGPNGLAATIEAWSDELLAEILFAPDRPVGPRFGADVRWVCQPSGGPMRPRSVLAIGERPATAADGRAADLEDFVNRDAPRVLGALTLITGDLGRAEDALQEALAKAWQHRDQPIEHLAAWITVVATNHARSGWRRSSAEARALSKVGGRAAPDQTSAGEPDEALLAALRALPDRERQVAVMHYVLDESVGSIAAALEIADGTVKTLLFRARQHLATELRLIGEGVD